MQDGLIGLGGLIVTAFQSMYSQSGTLKYVFTGFHVGFIIGCGRYQTDTALVISNDKFIDIVSVDQTLAVFHLLKSHAVTVSIIAVSILLQEVQLAGDDGIVGIVRIAPVSQEVFIFFQHIVLNGD